MFRIIFNRLVLMLAGIIVFSCNSDSEKNNWRETNSDNYQETSKEFYSGLNPVKGELVYVPVYSDIYGTDLSKKIKLSATLSIRNTDLDQKIVVSTVDYYDTHGLLIRHYLDNPVILKPLQTINYLVEYKEAKGGLGANFIVEWAADTEVSKPIIEAVMIGTASSLGISFVCDGRVIKCLSN